MNIKTGRPLVPANIETLKPYVAGKTIAEVVETYKPEKVAKLASNENRLGCSSLVKEAVNEALNSIHDYPDPVSRKLRAAIAERNNIDMDNIIVASGSESLISNLCKTFFLNRENAITADATFVGYFVQAGVRGIKLKRIPVTKEYKYDVKAMVSAIDDDTKMILIANPNNPTGTYIDRSEFEWLMDNVPEDVLVILDEAYFEYAQHVKDYPKALDYNFSNLISLRTFSKAYGLAGFRIGYAIADKEIIRNMMKTKLTFEPTSLAQAAALAAYRDDAFIEKSTAVVESGKQRLYKFLEENSVEYVESISNSVMMVLPDEETAIDITQKMLELGVILRRLNAFGLSNCIRVTIGTEDDMDHFEQTYNEIIKQ